MKWRVVAGSLLAFAFLAAIQLADLVASVLSYFLAINACEKKGEQWASLWAAGVM